MVKERKREVGEKRGERGQERKKGSEECSQFLWYTPLDMWRCPLGQGDVPATSR